MADSALHSLAAKTTAVGTDELYLVQSPFGAADDRRITLANLKASLELVEGPASASATSLARFDGTTGKLIQGSVVLLDSGGNMQNVASVESPEGEVLNLITTSVGEGIALSFQAGPGGHKAYFILSGLTEDRFITLPDTDLTLGAGGGSTTPGGSDTQLQFNDDGDFGGHAALTFDVSEESLVVSNLRSREWEPLTVKGSDSAGEGSAAVVAGGDSIGPGPGGDVVLLPGTGTTPGSIKFQVGGNVASMDLSALTADRIITFPDSDITLGSGNMTSSVYDPANVAQQIVGLTAVQTLTNKTLAAPSFTGTVTIGNGTLQSTSGGLRAEGSAGGAFNVTDYVYTNNIFVSAPSSAADAVAVVNATQTLTNKTLTAPTINDAQFGTTRHSASAVSASVALTTAYHVTLAGHASTPIVLTLPAAASHDKRRFLVKNTNNALVSLDGNASETIDGLPTWDIQKNEVAEIQSNGSGWFVVSALKSSRDTILSRGLGMVTETFPRALMNNGVALVSNAVVGAAVGLVKGDVISSIAWVVHTASASSTHGFVGIMDSTGVKVAESADWTTAHDGAAGLRTQALSSSYTVPTTGLYYIYVAVTATTPPLLYRGLNSSYVSSAISGGARPAFTQTGLTFGSGVLVPATAVTMSDTNAHFWFAAVGTPATI